jgi:hypothetical protein
VCDERPVPVERDDEPKQTTPKGAEIPVPQREDFLRNLEKIAPRPQRSVDGDDRRPDE